MATFIHSNKPNSVSRGDYSTTPSVGRKRQFVRVDYPQGQPVHVFKKNGGKEIEGLSYDKTNETYYKRDGKRKVNLGRDLAKAIEAVQDECDIPVPVHVTFKLPESSSLNEMVSESDELTCPPFMYQPL